MRWVLIAVLLVAAGCGPDDADERGYEELFDAAIEMYCPQPTTSACRNTARFNLSYLTAATEFEPSEVLAYMVDEMEPSDYGSFTLAVLESIRHLIFAE